VQTCFLDIVNFFKMLPHRPGCQGKANSATRVNASQAGKSQPFAHPR